MPFCPACGMAKTSRVHLCTLEVVAYLRADKPAPVPPGPPRTAPWRT